MRRFNYPEAFERIWSIHPVGVKKAGFEAWKRAKFSDDENQELEEYLAKRHRDDAKWCEGTFVPHLSTFLNGRRWEDQYQRVKRHHAHRDFEPTPAPFSDPSNPEAARAAFEELKKVLH